jgi:hypothetical protein
MWAAEEHDRPRHKAKSRYGNWMIFAQETDQRPDQHRNNWAD